MKSSISILFTLLLLVVIVVVTLNTAQGFRNREGFQLNDNAWINGLEWAGIVIGSLLVIFLIYTAMAKKGGNSNGNGY